MTASAINCTPRICIKLYFLSGKEYRDPRTKNGVLVCSSITVIAGDTPAAETVKPANCIVSKTAIMRSFVCGKSFMFFVILF